MKNIIEKYFKNKNYLLICPKTFSYGGVFETLSLSLRITKYYNKKKILCVPFLRFNKKQYQKNIFGISIILNIFNKLTIKEKIYSFITTLILNFILLLKLFKLRGLFGYLFGKNFIEKYLPITIGFEGLKCDFRENIKYFGETDQWEKVMQTKINFKLDNIKKNSFLNKPKKICFYIKDENYSKISEITIGATSDVNLCKKALNFFISKNFNIVRVGDKLSESFNFDNDNYFDLTKSSKLSQSNQFKTFEESEFYFGSASSASLLCNFFEKKSIFINVPHNTLSDQALSFNKNNFIIFKKVFCLKQKKILSISEIFNDKNLFVSEISELVRPELTTNNINAKKYILIENLEEEIFDVAKEFYDYNFNNQRTETPEMKEFSILRLSAINKLLNSSKEYFKYDSLTLYKNAQITVSTNYLKKYLYPSKFLVAESDFFRKKFNI